MWLTVGVKRETKPNEKVMKTEHSTGGERGDSERVKIKT